jgi:hypothetical protein
LTGQRITNALIRLPAAATLLIVACAVAALSARALIAGASNADTLDLAASIESGSSLEAPYFAQFVASHGLDRASTECGDAFTRASLTVNLAAFETARTENDLPLADAALVSAIGAAKRRLRCNPLDGNAWLREAMLEARAGGVSPTVIAALQLSYWTAPSEAWILGPRLVFATNLVAAGVSGFELEYQADLRRFAAFAAAERVAAAYVDGAPLLRGPLRPLIVTQPENRRKAIVAEIDRLGVDFTKAPSP